MDTPALMLDLVLHGGARVGLPYSFLTRLKLDPSGSLTLQFAECEVTIEGRALGPLYNNLLAHLATRISASDTPFDDGRTRTWVKSIRVEARDKSGSK